MNALLEHTPVMAMQPVPTMMDPSPVSATGDTLGMDLNVQVRNVVFTGVLHRTKLVICNQVSPPAGSIAIVYIHVGR